MKCRYMPRSHAQYQSSFANIHQNDALLGTDSHPSYHPQCSRSSHLSRRKFT